jgi:hypothetical protein
MRRGIHLAWWYLWFLIRALLTGGGVAFFLLTWGLWYEGDSALGAMTYGDLQREWFLLVHITLIFTGMSTWFALMFLDHERIVHESGFGQTEGGGTGRQETSSHRGTQTESVGR